MRRRDFIAAFGATFALFACGESSPTGGNPPPPPPPPPVPGADATVVVEDFAFVDPDGNRNDESVVNISVGQAVGWRHVGTVNHTVTSTSEPAGALPFDRQDLASGETFLVTFTVPGTYLYQCDLHPQTMFNATIIVA